MPRSRLILIVVAIALPVLAFASLAVAAGGSDDRIAKGVTVNGVPVGDMTMADAKRHLTERVRAPGQRPVQVAVGKRTFKLSARKAGVRMDIPGAVVDAMSAGEEGGFVSRGWRKLTGGGIDRDVELTVGADRGEVRSFIGRIQDKMGRRPKDATLDIKLSDVSVTKERKGRRLAGSKTLERKITAALAQPRADRRFEANVESIKAKVTRDEIHDKQPVAVTVSKSERMVRVFRRGKMVKSYGVAIGSAEYPTTPGQFDVQTKQVNPVWNVPNSTWAGGLAGQTIPGGAANNPLKLRWIGFNGGEGFHGSSDTGAGAQSHGCVRMVPGDVVDLYDRVDVGTPVLVA